MLIIRGAEAGVAAGLVCVLFRFLLSKAEEYLYIIIDAVKGSPVKSALWIAALAVLGIIVAKIIKLVPDAASSGIPQVNAEVKGLLSPAGGKLSLQNLWEAPFPYFQGLVSAGRGRAFSSAQWRQRARQK